MLNAVRAGGRDVGLAVRKPGAAAEGFWKGDGQPRPETLEQRLMRLVDETQDALEKHKAILEQTRLTLAQVRLLKYEYMFEHIRACVLRKMMRDRFYEECLSGPATRPRATMPTRSAASGQATANNKKAVPGQAQ